MVKKVIQVPVDEKLLTSLDKLSKKHGYERLPEEPEIGDAQIALVGEILRRELWKSPVRPSSPSI